MEMVRTKKRFIELINEMGKPVLYHGDYRNDWDNISQSFTIEDNKDRNKKFNLPGCRYISGELSIYEKKEKKLIMKYERWLYETWGNYGYIVRNTDREY